MERENKKRGREQEGEDQKKEKGLCAKTSKKHYERNINFQVEVQDESESNVLLSDKYLAFGVFDFPWLHEDEGMISKTSEEWNCFQDTFSSSLDGIFTQDDHVELFSRQYLSEIADNKFDENVWPFKAEEELEIGNVDCIWSSMINQQQQQPIQGVVPHH
ncbi:hypothetical protein OWV82_023940 [Melia azedarach]|uniref:Uncharacterized protein n=1 Tax=Melia azedarach TaxID=155640 RepID=A0ACC1WZS4_MELAZ|nr:hypothetical protein OWV82_023940 [Melia azedarach]